jgi:GNAT superfamily N-acetyltransferase
VTLPLARLGDVELGWLADLPAASAGLARLHHGHWAALMPDWSLPEAIAELEDHATRRAFPTTWIARQGDRIVGSVSLVTSDAAQFPHYTPWLSSLFVLPEFRGRGIGEALVGRLLFAARRWDFAAVHLFTEGPITLYRRTGFEVIEETRLFDKPVRILRYAVS